MNILDWICEHELPAYEERLAKLESIGAPAVMIESQKEAVDKLRNGDIVVGGNKELLAETVEGFEVKRGNGGKQYVEFNGAIRYFPQAKYGRFITA